MDLSEYEQQRLRNMAENARVLSELGVADAASSLRPEKRPRAPASSTPREFQPRTKMRTSYRSAGVAADDEAAKSAALQLAAKDQPFRGPNPNSPYVPRPQGPPPLSDEQRANLAAAKEGWLGKMEAWLRSSGASEFNTKKVMERVYELVSGQGVPLRGLYSGAAFEGRAVKLTDDLVELRATGKRLYGKYDIGGWSINHPIGKMIKVCVRSPFV